MAEKSNKFKEIMRAVKFTLISISAGIVQIGLFTLLNEIFNWNYWVSYLIALLASIIWNFTINRKVTFKAANNVTKAMLLVLAFYAVFTPVSTILGELAEQAIGTDYGEYIVLAVTMILNFVLEYLYTRFIVYRNSCDTAAEPAEGAEPALAETTEPVEAKNEETTETVEGAETALAETAGPAEAKEEGIESAETAETTEPAEGAEPALAETEVESAKE